MAEGKGKYNKLSQKAYEKKMQGFADSLKKQTERMTKKQGKAWLGDAKIVEVEGPSGIPVPKPKKIKKGKK
jgi:hypothetical protein